MKIAAVVVMRHHVCGFPEPYKNVNLVQGDLEKCSMLFKVKESENLNHPDRHRDRHPYLVVFRGLTSLRLVNI